MVSDHVGNMDRAVMAFDLETGEVVWNYRNKSFPYFSSPALTEKQVLIGGRDKGLHCIKRISGKLEWRFAARGRIDSSPVIAQDKVVFGSMDGKLYVYPFWMAKKFPPTKSERRSLLRRPLRAAASSSDVKTARFTHSQPATKHPSRYQMTQKNLIKTDRETKDETKAGSYFVSNYPPFSAWNEKGVAYLPSMLNSPSPGTAPLGLYYHVPFCRKRCHFCYFRVYTDKKF